MRKRKKLRIYIEAICNEFPSFMDDEELNNQPVGLLSNAQFETIQTWFNDAGIVSIYDGDYDVDKKRILSIEVIEE